MAYDYQKKYICPRLVDYILIVGSRNPNHNDSVAQTPELLRRYPLEDHHDFPLSPDIVFFCQPEGCISVGPKRLMLRESTSFVFTLTDKDSGRTRYGICISFYRPFERRLSNRNKAGRNVSQISTSSGEAPLPPVAARTIPRPKPQANGSKLSPQESLQLTTRSHKPKYTNRLRNHTLTSLCLISHHPFFCSFREILFTLKKFIECCSERSCGRKIGSSKNMRDTVWGVLTGLMTDNCPNVVMHDVREIEMWILRLLSAPVPVPGKTRVELYILPNVTHNPMIFATPDHTRFSLIDFPLHLPLELLGVDTCLKVLVLIMLENKIILQSRDYNALSMSVIAFISLMYPLEYMFPVIPLLPTCMNNAEQLLLVPTPYLIGLPSSFLMYKKGFRIPDDVWLVDLDSNKIYPPECADDCPELPEPEGSILKNHLKQALASMSASPQPIKNMESIASVDIKMDFKPQLASNEFNPLIYGNDMDSIDVATRVAMVRFFNSPNILGNYSEHSRTLRLYPRPVVAFQLNSFLKSRPSKTNFINRLARTQAVEYFVEWALSPTNSVFLRIHMNIFDPSIIGDKAKWFSQNLQKVDFHVYDEDSSSLGDALNASYQMGDGDTVPTDESGSDSDGADSTSSSYSSLSEFVDDMQISSINGETPSHGTEEHQVMAVDILKVYHPPTKLQLPDDDLYLMPNKSANSDQESEISSDSEKNFELETKTNNSQQSTFTESHRLSEEGSFDKMPPRRPPPPSAVALNKAISIDKQLISQSAPNTAPVTTDRPSLLPPKQTSLTAKNKSTSDDSKPSILNPFSGGNFASLFGDSIKHKFEKIDIDKMSETVSQSVRETGMKVREVREKAEVIMSETLSEAGSTKSTILTSKSSRPFAPLGNRKSLSEKAGSLKHNALQGKVDPKRDLESDKRSLQHLENQQFLKEVCALVFEGRGVHFFKVGRIKKLSEDENYRNFIVSRLNTSLEKKLSDEHQHLEDVCVSKQVWKGMLTIIKALIQGLEVTYQSQGPGGMSSALMVLEIIHTHYFEKEGSNKSETSNQSLASSPFGSSEALSMTTEQKLAIEDQIRSASDVEGPEELKSGKYLNKDSTGDLNRRSQPPHIGLETCSQRDSSGYMSEGAGDLLREIVKNKFEMLPKKSELHKVSSVESDISADSSLMTNTIRRKRSTSSFLSSKSHLSAGYRYREGKIHNLNFLPTKCTRTYLFESLIDKDRSSLWDQIQFWEDVFLDAVAQERDIIGLDQGPIEMMERYKSMNDSEKKRLEYDEDRLLGIMLYNMVSFMIMMNVNRNEVKRKTRRLLGKGHIGLNCSQDINMLLDQIDNLRSNDIDLKPLGSRLMQKQSFTVHWGVDNTGDMLFMEVCDDCLILRSVSGAICDRWWFEKLVNMTYCPKTKVFCLWRNINGQSQLNKFYTKKCKELYMCVKESMEKASSRNDAKISGLEMGNEFPIHDLKSGQGGLLQVCMEGIGLLFANSKSFIELSRIKKCFTAKGGIFVLEEFDPKNRKIVQRRFRSQMASQICYAVLCVFSYVAASMDRKKSITRHTSSFQHNNNDNKLLLNNCVSTSKTL